MDQLRTTGPSQPLTTGRIWAKSPPRRAGIPPKSASQLQISLSVLSMAPKQCLYCIDTLSQMTKVVLRISSARSLFFLVQQIDSWFMPNCIKTQTFCANSGDDALMPASTINRYTMTLIARTLSDER